MSMGLGEAGLCHDFNVICTKVYKYIVYKEHELYLVVKIRLQIKEFYFISSLFCTKLYIQSLYILSKILFYMLISIY